MLGAQEEGVGWEDGGCLFTCVLLDGVAGGAGHANSNLVRVSTRRRTLLRKTGLMEKASVISIPVRIRDAATIWASRGDSGTTEGLVGHDLSEATRYT